MHRRGRGEAEGDSLQKQEQSEESDAVVAGEEGTRLLENESARQRAMS